MLHAPHQHLITLHLFLKLFYFAIKLGKLVLLLQSRFRFNPHQLMIIEYVCAVVGLLSFGKLQVLIADF